MTDTEILDWLEKYAYISFDIDYSGAVIKVALPESIESFVSVRDLVEQVSKEDFESYD